MVPIFIGFFITIPDWTTDSFTGTCTDLDWAPFIATMGFYAVGYEVAGNTVCIS